MALIHSTSEKSSSRKLSGDEKRAGAVNPGVEARTTTTGLYSLLNGGPFSQSFPTPAVSFSGMVRPSLSSARSPGGNPLCETKRAFPEAASPQQFSPCSAACSGFPAGNLDEPPGVASTRGFVPGESTFSNVPFSGARLAWIPVSGGSAFGSGFGGPSGLAGKASHPLVPAQSEKSGSANAGAATTHIATIAATERTKTMRLIRRYLPYPQPRWLLLL